MPAPIGFLSAQTAVLPFYATGSPSILNIHDAPEYLQEAFHFFFEIQKDYPLLSNSSTNRSLREAGFRGENQLSPDRAKQICIHTGAQYLLTGAADFQVGTSNVVLTALTYICRSGQTMTKSETGAFKNIQSMISELVNAVSSYAKTVPDKKENQARNSLNLSVLLDMSGSMSADMTFIERSLRSASGRIPDDSKMDAYLLRSGRVDRMRDNGSPLSVINRIFKEKPSGRSTGSELLRALALIEKDYRWSGQNRLLIFTDVDFPGGRMNDVESILRKLKSRGMDIALFILSGQGYEEKIEWMRIARILNLNSPDVIYGRRVGFLEGFSRMILMNGNRFYTSDRDITPFIQKNIMPESLREIDTVHYGHDVLNLNDIPSRFAKTENLHIGGYGPVESGLESKIYNFITQNTVTDQKYRKILLKNKGRSFWIRVADEGVYRKMIQDGGAFYAGLRFLPGQNQEILPENIPEHVYYKKQNSVPRMFINEWEYFSKLPDSKINSHETWFFLVTVQRSDDGGENEDIRK